MGYCKSGLVAMVFLFFGFSGSCQQGGTDSVALLVKELSMDNTYAAGATLGIKGVISKQYQRYHRLVALASREQLVQLAAGHKSAVVRLYAWQALRRKKMAVPASLVKQFSTDREKLSTVKGCIRSVQTVSALAREKLE
jgi:hypothetical protein